MWKLSLFVLVLSACGDNVETQLITGRIGASFPSPISSVEVLKDGRAVASSNVAADGSFALIVHPGRGLSLHLVSATGHSTTVFPRVAGGTIERSFEVRGSGVPFDLGTLHFVNLTTKPFVFKTADEQATTCDDDGEDAEGAQCVDDGDNQDGQCGEQDEDEDEDEEGEDEGEDEGEHEDEDDDDDDGAANEGQNGPDQGDAVADHNFPDDGCADGDDNGGDDEDEDDDGEDD